MWGLTPTAKHAHPNPRGLRMSSLWTQGAHWELYCSQGCLYYLAPEGLCWQGCHYDALGLRISVSPRTLSLFICPGEFWLFPFHESAGSFLLEISHLSRQWFQATLGQVILFEVTVCLQGGLLGIIDINQHPGGLYFFGALNSPIPAAIKKPSFVIAFPNSKFNRKLYILFAKFGNPGPL